MDIAQAGPRIDALFSGWTEPGAPGGALAIVHRGETVVQRSYGNADIEHDVANSPDTRFHIASVTKTFVGAALHLLEAAGALALDDDVRRFVPELTLDAPISIRQLLCMLSGLRDSMEAMRLRGVWFRYPRCSQDLLDLLFSQRSLSYPTGERYVYTNINFNVCALIIARVSDRSFANFLASEIFRPLGMNDTILRESHTDVTPRLAEGYVLDEDGAYHRGGWAFGVSGAGSLVSTVPDLVRWLEVFRSGRLGALSDLTERMAERGRLNNGTPTNYGTGCYVRRYRGLTVLGHGGSLPGYKAQFSYVPERQLGVVLLANRDDAEPYRRMEQMVEACLDDDFPESHLDVIGRETMAIEAASGSTIALDGRYADPVSGEPLLVRQEEGRIVIDKLGHELPLWPDGTSRFRGDWASFDTTLRVERDDGGVPLLHLDFGGQLGVFAPVPELELPEVALADYVGDYWNDALQTGHSVFIRDGRLVTRYGPAFHAEMELSLTPLIADVFLAHGGRPGWTYQTTNRFLRDAGGQVTAVLVSSDRLKDTRLERIG